MKFGLLQTDILSLDGRNNGNLLSVTSFYPYIIRINHQLVNIMDDSARVRTNDGDEKKVEDVHDECYDKISSSGD